MRNENLSCLARQREASPRLLQYCRQQIQRVMRLPQGILTHPFIVPGGIFHDELWDWDSFWLSEGVFAICDCLDESLRKQFVDHALGSWKNFLENQSATGAIPIMIKGERGDFFGCDGRGGRETNLAKPVFGQFALSLARVLDGYGWLEPYYSGLKRFHRYWLEHYRHRSGLYVWGSDVAIGVDNDPATYGRPEFSSANLLLNCLMYKDLLAMRKLADTLKLEQEAVLWAEQAQELRSAVLRECWDQIDGFFYSVDVQVSDHRDHYLPGLSKGMGMTWSSLPIKIKMFTGFLPLWCGIATREQAEILVKRHLRNPREFMADYGVRSMAANERVYDPDSDTSNPSNWLGPIWIVANYMVQQGLKAYGYRADASEISRRVRVLLEEDLNATGTLHECYHPDTGKGNFNADFLSWNVLVLAM